MKKNYSILRIVLKLALVIFGASFAYQLLPPAPVSQHRQHVPKSAQSSNGSPKTSNTPKTPFINEQIDSINYLQNGLEVLPIIFAIAIAVYVAYVLWQATNPTTEPQRPNASDLSHHNSILLNHTDSSRSKDELVEMQEQHVITTGTQHSDSSALTINNSPDSNQSKKAREDEQEQNVITIASQGSNFSASSHHSILATNAMPQLVPISATGGTDKSITPKQKRVDTLIQGLAFTQDLGWFVAAKQEDQLKSLKEKYTKNNSLLHIQNSDGNNAFHLSAIHGNLEHLQFLAPKYKQKDLDKAFMLSVRHQKLQCIKYLLELGADINIKDTQQDTALHFSAMKGNKETIKCLVHERADINIKNKNGYTALHLSAFKGDLGSVERLVPSRIETSMPRYKDTITNVNKALLFSIQRNHVRVAMYLVKQGANINAKFDFNNRRRITPLLMSAQYGHFKCLKFLLENKADIHAKDSDGNTALIWSAEKGCAQCITYLLQQGAVIDTKNENGSTALMQSAYGGHLDCVKLLEDQGALINKENIHGQTAFLVSAKKGHVDCLKFLLEKGADIHEQDNNKDTALHWSATYGHVACLKFLLEKGADINAKNATKDTALQLSAQQGHLDCVKYFLQQGADPTWDGFMREKARQSAEEINDSDNEKISAETLQERKKEVIQYLKRYKSKRLTPWFKAAKNGNIEQLEKLFSKNDINVNTEDKDGNTALHLSAQEKKYKEEEENRLACVKFLVKHGAHTDTENSEKKIALQLAWEGSNVHRYLKALQEWFTAAKQGHKQLLQSLLKKDNISVNARDKNNKTALQWSAKNGYLDCLKYLLQQGADLTWEGSERKKAYELATNMQESEVAEYLNTEHKKRLKEWFSASRAKNLDALKDNFNKKDINVNVRDKDGKTALILSAEKGYLDCVKYLLGQGADLTWQGEDGKNALTLAQENKKKDVVEYLTRRNAQLEEWFEAAKNGKETDLKQLFKEGDINVDARDMNGYTALLWSAQGPSNQQSIRSSNGTNSNIDSTPGGYHSCVIYLVSKGANIHARDDIHNSTPLLKSAGCRQHDILIYLLTQGANVTDQDDDGYTAFLLSAYSGRLKSFQYLLSKFSDNFNIENSNRYGNTALLLSAQNGRTRFVKYLLEQGANIHAINKERLTALRLSVDDGYIACVKLLVDEHRKKQLTSQQYHAQFDIDIAFVLSARKGYLECLKYLHNNAKANVEHKNNQGKTALILSAEGKKNNKDLRSNQEKQQYLECVEYLVNTEQVNINAKDNLGNTALHLSAYYGKQKRVEFLLGTINNNNKKHADINAKNQYGETALIKNVKNKGIMGIVKCLVEAGAIINETDNLGYTALHWSAYNGNKEVIRYLVNKKDADINVENKDGNTALQLFLGGKYKDSGNKIKNLLSLNKK